MTSNNIAVTKTLINSFIVAVFGFAFTIIISILTYTDITRFIGIVLLLWVIISILYGLFLNHWKEGLIHCAFITIFTFVIIFFSLILLTIFSTTFIDVFSEISFYPLEKILRFSFLYTFIITLILAGISLGFSILGFFFKKWYKDSQGVKTTNDIEAKHYSKYDQLSSIEIHDYELEPPEEINEK